MRIFFFFKQKTAYEMRISDWSSDVCSSDLDLRGTCPATVTSAAKLPPPRDNSGCLPIEEVDVELVEGIGVLELRPVATFIEDDILGAGDHFSDLLALLGGRGRVEIGRAHV